MGDGISALQIRMLGDFSITYHGQRLCLKNSLTTKSMIALQLLLYRGEAGAARETLVDALFYNDNSADPLNNLKVTVSNLRRFLASAGLPPEMTVRAKSKRYYFSSPEPVWLDTAAFDKWLEKAGSAVDEEEKCACLLEACNLYAGDFLPHLAAEDWAAVAAAHYRQRYFDCVRQLAELLKKQERWEELLAIATQAASLHHLEELQCLRIDCLMGLGRYQQAKEVYDQTVRELEDEFSVTPGQALVERFHQLNLAGKVSYDFIEIMACPGGCVHGGGQPFVSAKERLEKTVRAERAKALYSEDKKLPKRKSHKNAEVQTLYDEFLKEPNGPLAHKYLHTHYEEQFIYMPDVTERV